VAAAVRRSAGRSRMPFSGPGFLQAVQPPSARG
jgi:hypothetical protein